MENNQNQIETDTQEWDWELLNDDSHPQFQNPNSQFQPQGVDNDGQNNNSSFSDGNIIRCDYFSLEFNGHEGVKETGPDIETDKSGSETDSWLDPDQVQFTSDDVIRGNTSRAHFFSDSGSPTPPLSDDELHPRNYQNALGEVTHGYEGENDQNALGNGINERGENGELGPQNYQNALVEVTHEEGMGNDENALSGEINGGGENGGLVDSGADMSGGKSGGWWKVPLELLRYCVLRVRPVWSLSVAAAAIMGFVLLRRAWLVKIKRKSRNKGLSLNVTVDDKKVSQFMSRAARLNEAFSVVKRVPVIRPSFPTPGFVPWSVISMR